MDSSRRAFLGHAAGLGAVISVPPRVCGRRSGICGRGIPALFEDARIAVPVPAEISDPSDASVWCDRLDFEDGFCRSVSCTKHLSRVRLHEIEATMKLQECNLLHPRNDYVPSCRLSQCVTGLRPRWAAPVSWELG